MKEMEYSIIIDRSRQFVCETMLIKTYYSDWVSAWGEGMRIEGDWEEGTFITFLDQNQGGTKALIEELKKGEVVKMQQVAMVDSEGKEVVPSDEMMKKWIGSLEHYYFEDMGEERTKLRVVGTVDEVFAPMMETWNRALVLLKEICER